MVWQGVRMLWSSLSRSPSCDQLRGEKGKQRVMMNLVSGC